MDISSSLQYVFALLSNDKFELHGDLHMQKLLQEFKRESVTFVDMGIALFNEEKGEKYFFIKMVTADEIENIRQAYLLAISASQFPKWRISLNLQLSPTHVDHILQQVRVSVFKQVDQMISNSKAKMEKVRETQRIEKFANAHKRFDEESDAQRSITESRQAAMEQQKNELKRQVTKLKNEKKT